MAGGGRRRGIGSADDVAVHLGTSPTISIILRYMTHKFPFPVLTFGVLHDDDDDDETFDGLLLLVIIKFHFELSISSTNYLECMSLHLFIYFYGFFPSSTEWN